MIMTKNAVGNLMARYKTVLRNCSLMNTFGSLAVAGMLVLGGASGAMADTTDYKDQEFIGRSSDNNGGAINNSDSATITIDGCTFTENKATKFGGAIYNTGTVTISNTTFTENDALKGGAIYTTGSGLLTIEDNVVFDGNTGLVGAIAQQTGNMVVGANVSFINNKGTGGGGAIAAYNASTTIGEGTLFENNYAVQGGGAIWFSVDSAGDTTDVLTIASGTQFIGNITDGYTTWSKSESYGGGALYVTECAVVNIEGAVFADNQANTGATFADGSSNKGGAIHIFPNTAQNAENAPVVNFSGTNIFSNNTVDGVLNDIHNDGTVNVSGNMTLDGGITGIGTTNFKADSTLTIGDNTTLSQGSLTTEKGAKLIVNSVNGITVKNADIASGSWGYLSGSTAYDATTISSDSAFVQIDSVAFNGSTYTVTVSQVSASQTLDPSVNSGLASLIDKAIASGADSAGVDFIKNASLQSNGGTIIEGATKIAATGAVVPGLGSVNTAATSNMGSRTSIVPQSKASAASETSTWLAMNGDGAILPVADTGNMTQGFGIWFMPMFSHTSASGFSSGNYNYGYDTNIAGATLGADYTFAGDLRLGLAFNLGQGSSTITGDFATTENDFDYFGVSLYGAKHFADFGLSFDMGYTVSENDMVQDATDGNLYGNVDASMFTLGLKAEYLVALDGFNVTPYAGARFNYYDVDGYDTKQNGNALFNTASSDSTVWEFPVGVTFDTTSKVGSWDMTPSMALGVKFAAGDLDAEQEVSIAGVAGSSVLSSEVADAVTFQGGLGLAFAKDVCNISVNYTLDLSENVESHGVSLNLRYDF